ncbi:MAG: Uma2 family endonuclease, partial [Kovacikia sp.]
DQGFKKMLYEQLAVKEYWQFDPKGEWIEQQLQGYRLRGEHYEPITDQRSEPLQLRLEVDGQLIAFYREDTGEKLLVPGELAQALREEALARQQAEQRAEQAEQRAEQTEQQVKQLKERLRSLGIDPETIA